MTDAYVEVLIKSKGTAATRTLKIIIGLLIFVVAFVVISLLIQGAAGVATLGMFLPVIALIGFIIYILYTRTNVEYEYIMVNDTLVIDKIFSQKKRKRVKKMEVKDFEVFAKTTSASIRQYEKAPVLDCSTNDKQADTYTAVLREDKELLRVVIEPNEAMLNLMKLYLGKKLIME